MSSNFSFYSVDTRQPVCQFRSLSLFTYLMPVSRLPLQRVYAGSTSLFEYPIGPFLLFRTLVLSGRRLLFLFRKPADLTYTSTLSSQSFLRPVYSPDRLLFPLCTASRFDVLCKLCIPALPHRIPGTSSTEYFFTSLIFH